MNRESPFKMVDYDGGQVQAGRRSEWGMPSYSVDDLRTYVLIAGPGPWDNARISGQPVAKLEGLWSPEVGATIWVGEPNREVEVVAHRYEFTANGLDSMIFVRDPATPDG